MPDTFTFTNGNLLVGMHLTPEERAAVTRWQQSDAWEFEFHEGHTTGNPIYVRPTGNKDKSNLPKFDTKNKSASDYTDIMNLANGMKLRQALKNKDQTELMNIIRDSWDALSKMAEAYYAKK